MMAYTYNNTTLTTCDDGTQGQFPIRFGEGLLPGIFSMLLGYVNVAVAMGKFVYTEINYGYRNADGKCIQYMR